MSDRIYNFSAGPATLPEEVIRITQEALWDLRGSGIGVMEHSHRSAALGAIFEEAEATCREVAGIPDEYAVLFLQGGASLQFAMVPMNLLGEGATADYVSTGTWSQKAIAEAKKIGAVHVAASGEKERFTRIPAPGAIRWSEAPAYAHFTSNNTIYGTEWETPPAPPDRVPLVCDASSDIFSRPIDVPRYGLIYAGAQKNLGPAGVTLVIIRRYLAERAPETLPTLLQYRTHVAKRSLYNTPPVLGIFVMGEVFKWIRTRGGLAAMEAQNRAKAALLYEFLDHSELFRPTADKDSRSRMNVCFRAATEELEAALLREAAARGMSGLKGHRSVGGLRASIYNAFPIEGCRALVELMKELERKGDSR